MADYHPQTFRGLDEDATVRAILEGTATETGERFFAALVENLSNVLDTYSSWVTEYIEQSRQLRVLAFWEDGQLEEEFRLDVRGTPCEAVIKNADLVHYPDNIVDLFPDNDTIKFFSAVSYMGVPLLDSKGRVIGNLAVMDNQPMPEEPRSQVLFRIFAARAAAELQRIQAEAEIGKREEKYRRIVETAGESFILMDKNLAITDVNDAFCKLIRRIKVWNGSGLVTIRLSFTIRLQIPSRSLTASGLRWVSKIITAMKNTANQISPADKLSPWARMEFGRASTAPVKCSARSGSVKSFARMPACRPVK